MLSGDAFLALEDNHARAGVPTSEIWERVDARVEREDSLIAAQLRWNLRARAKHGFFETWSPFWFEFDQEFDRCERSVKQIVSASAISVLDAIVDGRIRPENEHVVEQLKSIALEWASDVQISSRIASSYRYRLLRWCAPGHSIATGSSCRKIIMRKNPFYPLWGRAFGREPGMKASALSFALGLLDDAADVREDIFSDQFNSVVSTIPQEGTASRDELVRHCLREDLAGKAVAVAETILRNLSKRDEGLFGLTCDSLLSSLEGYADFCRLRLVASEAISNAPRRALQQQFG